MSDFKPAKTSTINQFEKTSRRSNGCGCAGVGCLVIVVGLVVMCVGSYFALMHSSLPLALIESAIESDGNVRVDGLRGSISSGLEIDKLEFVSEESEHWNELRGVKFEFNGIFDLIRNQRLIIQEASIDGATIYARFDDPEAAETDPDFDWDSDGNDVAEEVNDEIEDIRRELESEDWGDLKELRIELVSAKDIEIINPESDARLKFDSIEFSNFLMLAGEIKSLGNINVASDQLDLETGPSKIYPEEKLAWQMVGAAKPPVHKSLIDDVPFVVDIAITQGNKLQLSASLCNDALRISEPWGETLTMEMTDFSPDQYFDLTTALVPSHWHATFVFGAAEQNNDPLQSPGAEDKSDPEVDDKDERKPSRKARQFTVHPDGHFILGETKFNIEPATVPFDPDGENPALMTATGKLNDTTITARLTLSGKMPLFLVELAADELEPQEIWSQLFFGEDWDQLGPDAQQEINEVVNPMLKDLSEPEEF